MLRDSDCKKCPQNLVYMKMQLLCCKNTNVAHLLLNMILLRFMIKIIIDAIKLDLLHGITNSYDGDYKCNE